MDSQTYEKSSRVLLKVMVAVVLLFLLGCMFLSNVFLVAEHTDRMRLIKENQSLIVQVEGLK